MYNNQELLKKHTALTISRKDVNTSFIMFPVRLETRFVDSYPVEDIAEPDRALYAFKALWSYVEALRNKASEKSVFDNAVMLMEKIENLDTVYREDKTRLKDLTSKVFEATKPEGELKKVWDRILQHIPRLATLDIINDNEATEYLRKLNRVNWTIRRMAENPMYMGKKRKNCRSQYSNTAPFKVARAFMKGCLPVLEQLLPEDPSKTILNRFSHITANQYQKFKDALSFFDIPYEQLDSVYMNFKVGGHTFSEGAYWAIFGSLRDGLTHDFEEYSIYRARFRGGEAFERNNEGDVVRVDYRSRKQSLMDKMKSKIGIYHHYTLFAEKMILWSLRLATTGVDIVNTDRLKIWRRIADNTMFSYHEEREWLLSLLKTYNDHYGKDDYYHRISGVRINANNKYIRNRKLSYKKNMKCLLVRIYPDEIAVTQMAKPLSREELINAREFWVRYLSARDDLSRKAAWTALCSLYTAPRAAYIARAQFPSDIGHLLSYMSGKKNGGDYLDPGLNLYFPKVDPSGSEDEMFSVPYSELMPDRFVLQADLDNGHKKAETIIQYGRMIPKSIQVGLDLNNQPDVTDDDGLKFKGNLRWMTDYAEAERMGMAITLPLDPYKLDHYTKKQKEKAKKDNVHLSTYYRTFKFNSIYVMGMKELSTDNAEDSKLCSALIQDIMNSHLYNEEGLELLKIGTPTNILTDEDGEGNSNYNTDEQAQIDEYFNKSIVPLRDGVKNGPKNGDASLLSRLFGFGDRGIKYRDNPFLNTANRDNVEILRERKVSSAFLSVLKDVHPILKIIDENSTLRNYFVSSVSPLGVFPPFRIGNQPYGIVPVCDFRYLKFRKGDPLYMVRELLLFLTEKWNEVAAKYVISEENMYTSGKTEERYLNAMSATPFSSSFYSRDKFTFNEVISENYFAQTKYNVESLDNIVNVFKTIDPSLTKDDLVKYYYPHFIGATMKDPTQTKLLEKFNWGELFKTIRAKLDKDLFEGVDDEHLNRLITGTFDLFNYRLDAWLTGLLQKRLSDRMYLKKTHKISIGAYGWVFNLKEYNTKQVSNEYVLAPSINHAVTASVLRSSFTRTGENSRQDFSMNVNLSSVRVRQALRIIHGVRNGLSLGAVLGSDLERLLHEDYKKTGLEMDYFIYYLRKAYPLNAETPAESTQESADKGFRDTAIDVLNGVSLIENLRGIAERRYTDSQKCQLTELFNFNARSQYRAKDNLEQWLCEIFKAGNISEVVRLFGSQDVYQKKILRLINLIQQTEDAYDALADVVTSESVYKLTEGNRVAVDALMNSMQSGRNIPVPDVTEIPLDSAHIEQRVFAALNPEVRATNSESLLQRTEPSLDDWMGKVLGFDDLVFQFVDNGAAVNVKLGDGGLGITPSELVYLSSDWEKFRNYLKVLWWKDGGSCPEFAGEGIFLDEAEIAIDSLREMIYHSREIRQDDFAASSKEIDDQFYAKEVMKERYEEAVNYIRNLAYSLSLKSTEITEWFKENPAMPISDDLLSEVIKDLTDCFRCGVLDALSGMDPSMYIESLDRFSYPTEFAELLKKQQMLPAKLSSLADTLSDRIKQAEAAKGGSGGNEELYQDAIKKLLIAPFLMITPIRVKDNPLIPVEKLKHQVTEKNCFRNADGLVVENNLVELSDVRKQLASLHQVRLYGKLNYLDGAFDVKPMQLDADDTDNVYWLGSEVESEDDLRDTNVYTVINSHDFLYTDEDTEVCNIAGLLIDFWVERIPYKRQTAALAFGYDQPDAEPPQAILVGVSTIEGNHHWSEKRMLRTIRSAMHQVKTRAVEPEHLARDPWASPLFPIIDINPDNMVPRADN